MPDLEGLRAIACLSVVFSHALPRSSAALRLLPLGAIGVQFFFALSGFLVTLLLLRSKEKAGAGQQGRGVLPWNFYARRALRMLPAYYLLIGVLWLLDYGMIRSSLHWHVLCLTNLWRASTGVNFLNHLWAVGAEMQYYLLWPLLLGLLPKRALVRVLPLLILAGPLYRALGWAIGMRFVAINTVPLSCLDTFGMGALLAVLRYHGLDEARRKVGQFGFVAGLLGLAAMVALYQRGILDDSTRVFVFGSIGALLYFAVIDKAVGGLPGVLGAAVHSGLFRRVGRVSYGIYLFHPLLWKLLNYLLQEWLPCLLPYLYLRILLLVLCSFAAATLSSRFVEEPFHRLKTRFPY